MVTALGTQIINGFASTIYFIDLLVQSLVAAISPPFRVKDTLRQIYFMANQSLIIVLLCVSFAAMVTVIESSYHMKLVVQNDEMVPGFAALLILRELGVVVAALLVTSRVGAGIAAEIGSMTVTEQVDALKMLGIDPVRYLVVPRLVASIISGMLLSIVSNVVCLFGAFIVSATKLGYTYGTFVVAMSRFVGLKDLFFAIIKGGCFGAAIPMFACFFGFRCKAGAEGVGFATTSSVVATSIAIIVMDFVLSYIFTFFY